MKFNFFNDSYHACVMYQQRLCSKIKCSSHGGEMDNKRYFIYLFTSEIVVSEGLSSVGVYLTPEIVVGERFL